MATEYTSYKPVIHENPIQYGLFNTMGGHPKPGRGEEGRGREGRGRKGRGEGGRGGEGRNLCVEEMGVKGKET